MKPLDRVTLRNSRFVPMGNSFVTIDDPPGHCFTKTFDNRTFTLIIGTFIAIPIHGKDVRLVLPVDCA